MKKLLLILLAAAAFYVGGAFRFAPLMITAGVIVIIMPIMFALSRALGKHISADFKSSESAAVKNTELTRALVCENGGGLPVSRFRAEITAEYRGEKPTKFTLIGSAEPKGKTETEFKITPPRCGLIRLELKKIKVCDYLNIFAAPKKASAEALIAVYPKEREMKISFAPEYGSGGFAERVGARGGGEDSEIRQLREYERGDSARLIHKNLSARMGEPWVKELEKQADYIINLNLDLSGAAEAGPDGLDVFYEVLSALCAGLLKGAAAVNVSFSVKGAARSRAVRGADDMRGLLLELYKTEPEAFSETGALTDGLTLSADSVLSRGGERIMKFTAENLDEELGRFYNL